MSNKYSGAKKFFSICLSALGVMLAGSASSGHTAPGQGFAAGAAAMMIPPVYLDTFEGIPLDWSQFDKPSAPSVRLGIATPYTVDPAPSLKGDTEIDTMTTSAVIGGVFGSVAIPMKNFPISSRWRPIHQRINACLKGNPCADPSIEGILRDVDGRDFFQKLSLINARVNTLVKYRRDRTNYGALDHWAAPDETLSLKSGDCEDYAILKMAGLARAGIPLQSMSLVVLHDSHRKVFHAVLSVSTSNGNYILDNLSNIVRKDTDLKSYVPLYSLSTDRAWIHGSRSGGNQLARVSGGFSSVAPGEGPPSADRQSAGIDARSGDFELRRSID